MFNSNHYVVRKKVISLLGATFEVFDDKNNLVLYAKQKAFKLREEMKFFEDREQKREVLTIKARNILDISSTYDIRDSRIRSLVGSIKRKGLKSILRDEWSILDDREREVGTMIEDSMGLAMVRRFFFNIIPQNYDYIVNGKKVADLKQQFNLFVYKMDVDILNGNVDKRVVLASAVILSLIEGRQE